MSSPAPTPAAAVAWLSELRGGLAATGAMLPFALVYGLLAYAALGPATAARAGLGAALTSMVLGAVVLGLVGRTLLPAASPTASACLILGSAIAVWARDPAVTPALMTALTGATVALAGALLLLLALLRAGSLVGFVPQPVLSGFLNGVAVLIVLSQAPVLLGLAPGTLARDGWAALPQLQWQPLAVGLGSAALMAALRRWAPRWPAALLTLLLASAAVAALQALRPLPLQTLGALAPTLPLPALPQLLADDAGRELLWRHAGRVLTTAALLALIGALETVLNLAAVDQHLRRRSDANRVLAGLGLANLVLGLLGALPVVYVRLRAMATAAGGGRSWRAILAGSVALCAVVWLAAPLGERLPLAVLAGVLLVLAWMLADTWSIRLLRLGRQGGAAADRGWSLAVMAAVCVVTVLWGFVAGVALGVLLSAVLLVRSLHRSLVRARASAEAWPSRRVYAPAQAALLATQRADIDVIELEGALFFGNVERLRREVETDPVPQRARRQAVVLDFRRVSTIDASAAVALAALRDRLAQAQTALLLAGVTADNRHGRVLLAHEAGRRGQAPEWRLHADADRAVEAAERLLLARAGIAGDSQAVALRDALLFEGLDDAAAARLSGLLQPRRLAAGERLFTEGEPGDALYVLGEGSITVRDVRSGQRFVSFSPGMCFGETAVLDGGGRSAEAVADEPSLVHRLAADDLTRLRQEAPEVAALVYLNLARHLSQRLRHASLAWRRSAA